MCTYSYISKTGGFIFSKCVYAYKTYFKNIQLAIENQNLSDMDVGFLTVNYGWEHCLNKLKYIFCIIHRKNIELNTKYLFNQSQLLYSVMKHLNFDINLKHNHGCVIKEIDRSLSPFVFRRRTWPERSIMSSRRYSNNN